MRPVTTRRARWARVQLPWPRTAIPAILSVVVLLTAGACGGAGSAGDSGSDGGGKPIPDITGMAPHPLEEPTTVTINVAARLETFASVFLADAMGEFEKENITVRYTGLPSTDALGILAQGDGRIDLLMTSMSAAYFSAVKSGVNVASILPAWESAPPGAGIWIRNEAVGNPGKLKGATFGSAGGEGSYVPYMLDEYLEQYGLDHTDVNIQRIRTTDMPRAIEQGAVTGGYVTCPTCQNIDRDVAQFVIPPTRALNMVLVGPRLLDKEPEVALAVVRAMARTQLKYLQGDYKEDPKVVSALAEKMRVPEEAITSYPPFKWSKDLALPDPDVVREVQQVWIESGDIVTYSEPIPYDHIYVDDFRDKVMSTRP